MLRFTLVLSSLAGLAMSAHAQDLDLDAVYDARQLSQIVATADLCGYRLDIERTSSMAKDIMLNGSALARAEFSIPGSVRKQALEEMDTTERNVTCEAQKKVASQLDLLMK